jgi:hypothetical protein
MTQIKQVDSQRIKSQKGFWWQANNIL